MRYTDETVAKKRARTSVNFMLTRGDESKTGQMREEVDEEESR